MENGLNIKLDVCKNWYVIQVKTRAEREALEFFENLFKDYDFHVFFPQVEKVFKLKGKNIIENVSMIPGYLIISTEKSAEEFLEIFYSKNSEKRLYYKILGKDDSQYMGIDQDEKDIIMKFCDSDYIMKKSIGIIKGDKVIVTKGALMGMESKIDKIDRHKQCAELKLFLMGDERSIKVPLEIIEKIV